MANIKHLYLMTCLNCRINEGKYETRESEAEWKSCLTQVAYANNIVLKTWFRALHVN